MEVNRGQLLFLLAIGCACTVAYSGDSNLEREKRDDNEWVVTSILVKPYLMKAEGSQASSNQFEGFIPDIMKKIGDKLNQKYRIQLVRDEKYGSRQDATWNGMIGEIATGVADISAAPLTVSEERKAVVDFTTPFMTFGTVILLNKGVQDSPPRSLAELLDQPNRRYGIINAGSTDALIKSSSDPEISRLVERLTPMNSIDSGISRVRDSADGLFGFIIEENSAEYHMKQEPCNLYEVKLDQFQTTRDYAIAVKKGFKDLDRINGVLDELKRSGEMEKLKKKWWAGPCSGVGRSSGEILTLTLAAAFTILLRR